MSSAWMPIVADTPEMIEFCEKARHFRDIENRFTYHAPKGDQADRYGAIRGEALAMAKSLLDRCPRSRELDVALDRLDEVVFFANAAIARNE